ncbi:MAG: hypothetical protein AAF225_01375 [Pseudomonadota bacterium]
MYIDKKMKKEYPKLSAWIEKNIPLVKTKKKVFDAYMKFSETNKKEALLSLSRGTPPKVSFRVMPKANGQYSGKSYTNTVFLAKAICERFEKSDSKKKSMHLLVESTVLHEMVHWGDWKDGKDQHGEEGKAFEKAAYGKDVTRYW